MRRSNSQSIASVIKELLDDYHLSSKLNEVHVVTAWDKVMGAAVARYTTEIFIKNRVLFVRMSHASLRQELTYGKDKIISMLNDEVGLEVILDVKFI